MKFEVDKIIKEKIISDKKYFLVKWRNFELNESTWEP